jgi:hypothetical protein
MLFLDLSHIAAVIFPDDGEPSQLAKANPKTDEEYRVLAQQITKAYIERLQSKPRYTVFVDEMVKGLLSSLTDVEARKVNSAVGVIANQKTQEAKDAKSGKKKVRAWNAACRGGCVELTGKLRCVGQGQADSRCYQGPLSKVSDVSLAFPYRLLNQSSISPGTHKCTTKHLTMKT